MEQIILFTTLAIFPFGQIIRMGIIHPIDVMVILGAIYTVYKKYTKPEVFKFIDNFILFAFFSWLFSILYFQDIKIFYGLLYLIRLISYLYFSLLVYHFANSSKNKALILNSLLSLSIVSALFGWIQLLFIPDIKALYTFGWDEHLYRLVGTFLDPTYLGLLLVFGILISINQKKYTMSLLLAISLLFTYSRASFLALFISIIYIALKKIISLKFLIIIPLFLLLILIIPTTKNKSLRFFRTFTTHAKLQNYVDTIKIYRSSPVFGIGYNNLCFVKNKLIMPESYKSHSCSGSDSSLLYILTTTGVIGFISFVNLLFYLWKSSNNLFRSILISVLIHSCFSNSLFYPWIIFYLLTSYFLLRAEVDS